MQFNWNNRFNWLQYKKLTTWAVQFIGIISIRAIFNISSNWLFLISFSRVYLSVPELFHSFRSLALSFVLLCRKFSSVCLTIFETHFCVLELQVKTLKIVHPYFAFVAFYIHDFVLTNTETPLQPINIKSFYALFRISFYSSYSNRLVALHSLP